MAKIYDTMGSLIYEDDKIIDTSTIKAAQEKGVDMSFAHFSQRDFRGLDLSCSKLIGVRFISANLANTDCTDANLTGSDFTCANLSGANLRGANLRGANLRSADLSGADLFGADLRGANITKARLAGARLYKTKMDGARIYASVRDFNVSSPDIYEEAKIELWAYRGFGVKKISWGKLWASGELWNSLLILKEQGDNEENNG